MTRPQVSFEFFPPRTVEASFRLWDSVQTLAPLEPRFVSVTYGAGGTTRSLTQEAVHALHATTDLTVAAHLTCVEASRAETLQTARDFVAAGGSEIVALRGDPPKGRERFETHPEGFASSVELVAALREALDVTIRVGAYPEPHPEALSPQADIDWLKAKLDAGADEAITQFFFEADTFLRFRDACAQAGIDHPITPGILPIESWSGAKRFAARCGMDVPAWLDEAYTRADRDNRAELLSVALATEICDTLLEEGVQALHFYTLNRPHLTRDICHALGITPQSDLRKVA